MSQPFLNVCRDSSSTMAKYKFLRWRQDPPRSSPNRFPLSPFSLLHGEHFVSIMFFQKTLSPPFLSSFCKGCVLCAFMSKATARAVQPELGPRSNSYQLWDLRPLKLSEAQFPYLKQWNVFFFYWYLFIWLWQEANDVTYVQGLVQSLTELINVSSLPSLPCWNSWT